MWKRDYNYDPQHDDPDYQAMDEKQLESQSRLLIELGEPEAWLETMLRAAKRSASHADDIGDRAMSGRWRDLARSLERAAAATALDPMQAGEPGDSAIQSQTPRLRQSLQSMRPAMPEHEPLSQLQLEIELLKARLRLIEELLSLMSPEASHWKQCYEQLLELKTAFEKDRIH